jgi:hypothetical protein
MPYQLQSWTRQQMHLPFPFSGNSSGNSLAVSHQVSFVRTVRTRGGSNGREDHEPGHLVCDPSHRLRPYVCTSSLKVHGSSRITLK